MKKDKGIALIILIIIIILVMPVLIFLFMNIIKDKTPNRNESNIEYTNTMKTHMEEKYSTSFEVVDSIFPEGGFNTGMLQNIVTLKDSDGVRCNVKADLNSPYDFYDDYIDSCTASLIEAKLDSKLLKSEEARVYVSVEDDNINKADITLENVKSITLVGSINHSPEENDVKELYEIYSNIEELGYRTIFFIVGFVNDSDEFDLAVNNYYVYGKSNWSDYKGTFYAYLTVKDSGLSFEDFEACITKP